MIDPSPIREDQPMSEASTAGTKVTEAHESLQRWLKDNKGVDIAVEHVAAVVLNFPKWQSSPERLAEREQVRKDRDLAVDAKREQKRVEQEQKRQAADAKREQTRVEQDAKRKAADEKREQKRQDQIAKQAKADEDHKAKQKKREADRAEKQRLADEKRQAAETKKAEAQAARQAKAETEAAEAAAEPATENGSEPASNEETGRGGLRAARSEQRRLKKRGSEPVGASADTF